MDEAKTLVITGGAQGLGACVARRAAALGVRVAVIHRNDSDPADRLVRQITGAGGACLSVVADIGREDEVDQAFARIEAESGPIGGLVNNAVRAGDRKALLDWSVQEVESVFRSNVIGAFLATRAAVRHMLAHGAESGGAIVSMSSAVAIATAAPHGWIPFAASKAALEVLTRGVAKEFADRGIRANTVRVGVADTPTRWTQGVERVEHLVRDSVPMRRIGTQDEVANAVLWLLSDEAAYVTGATLDVAGGI